MGDAGGVSIRKNSAKWMIERFDSPVDIALTPTEPEVDQREGIARHFVDCVSHGATPLVTGRSGYVNSAILEALYRSSETGAEVRNFFDPTL
jgi:predicted dehydrogenase